MSSWRDCLREVEQATGSVLRSSPLPRSQGPVATLEIPTSSSSHAMGVAAFTSGMGPLLARWIEDGSLVTDPGTATVLARHLDHGRRRHLRLTADLDRAVALLREAGVTPVVIKGTHTAEDYFVEPAARPRSDIDLVVDPAEFRTSEALLSAWGYVRRGGTRHPPKSDWVPPGEEPRLHSLHLTHELNPRSVDLHASLERTFYGVRRETIRLTPGLLRPWDRMGGHASVLRQPALLWTLAAHASEGLHNLTLLRLVEIVTVIREDTERGELDWDEVSRWLAAVDGERFVFAALALAERLAPGTVEPAFLQRLGRAAPPRLRRAVEGLAPSDAQRLERLSLTERFLWARGPGEHARRAFRMLAPDTTDGSLIELARLYAERAFRLVRGRVRLRADAPTRAGRR